MRTATPKTTRAAPVTHPKKPVAAKAPVTAKPQRAAVAPSPALKHNAIDVARAKPIAPGVEKSVRKAKAVRGRFTMPEADYDKLTELKSKCVAAGMRVKKSELVRIGLHFLETLPIARLKAAITALESVTTGRKAAAKAAKNGKLAKVH
jgi:hypothetical protein